MYAVIDWIHPAQNVERFQAVVDMKVNFLDSMKSGSFFEQTSDQWFLKMNSIHMAHFLPR
jgi:hypothetical protein